MELELMWPHHVLTEPVARQLAFLREIKCERRCERTDTPILGRDAEIVCWARTEAGSQRAWYVLTDRVDDTATEQMGYPCRFVDPLSIKINEPTLQAKLPAPSKQARQALAARYERQHPPKPSIMGRLFKWSW